MKKNQLIAIGVAVAVVIIGGIAAVMWKGQKTTNNPSADQSANQNEISGEAPNLQVPDPVTGDYTDAGQNYKSVIPEGWYGYESPQGVTLFAKVNNLSQIDLNTNPDIGPTFIAGVTNITDTGASTPDEWLELNGVTGDNQNELIIESEEVELAGKNFWRIVQDSNTELGNIVHYLYFSANNRLISLSHYPYVEGSSESADFEEFVKSIEEL